MPKMVRCFKDGEEKFHDVKNIPAGWIIDRLMPNPEPVLSSGLDITGQPDAFKEGTVGKQPNEMGESNFGGVGLAARPGKEKNKKSKVKE